MDTITLNTIYIVYISSLSYLFFSMVYVVLQFVCTVSGPLTLLLFSTDSFCYLLQLRHSQIVSRNTHLNVTEKTIQVLFFTKLKLILCINTLVLLQVLFILTGIFLSLPGKFNIALIIDLYFGCVRGPLGSLKPQSHRVSHVCSTPHTTHAHLSSAVQHLAAAHIGSQLSIMHHPCQPAPSKTA